jgi:hypothetical protein
MIKSRWMRTTHIGESRKEYKFLPGIYNGKQHLGNLDIGRRIILKLIFGKRSLKLYNRLKYLMVCSEQGKKNLGHPTLR